MDYFVGYSKNSFLKNETIIFKRMQESIENCKMDIVIFSI